MLWCLSFCSFICNLSETCEKRKKEGCSDCNNNDCSYCTKKEDCSQSIYNEKV